MIRFFLAILFSMVLCSYASAQVRDYTELFEVDLDEELPSLEELTEKYYKPDEDFDRKYDYHWNIGDVFDAVFRSTIISYGSSNVRIKNTEEATYEKMLSVIPEQYWEYIGPFLHSVPGVPEKILNMPGIKETKNKFPTRIAMELEGIEDLEFISPYLYFMLMPEMWPSYYDTMEKPKKMITTVQGKTKYNPDFFKRVKELVPDDDYLPNAVVSQSLKSRLRTLNPTKDSPLSAADIKAFVNTIQAVEEFGAKDYRMLDIMSAGYLLDAWEKDNDRGLPIQALKAVVNPCQRLAQKIRLAGLENEFLKVVGKEGFDLKSWAYTCDKTIRAYRVATVPASMIATIKKYQNALYEPGMENIDYESAEQMYATMQSVAEMYKAPMDDILEAMKEKDNIYKELMKIQDSLIDSPIVR